MHSRSVVAALISVWLGACRGPSEPSQVVCTAIVMPAVVVAIFDAQSGAPVADSAAGTVADGAYSDSLRAYAFDSSMVLVARAAAYERPGTYSMLIQRSGYQQWSVSGVRVGMGVCHVNTVLLRADMSRRP